MGKNKFGDKYFHIAPSCWMQINSRRRRSKNETGDGGRSIVLNNANGNNDDEYDGSDILVGLDTT